MKEIAGETLDDQQDMLGKLSVDAFIALAKTAGFVSEMQADTGILVPGSFAYCVVSPVPNRQCVGLKWSVCGDKHRADSSVGFLNQS